MNPPFRMRRLARRWLAAAGLGAGVLAAGALAAGLAGVLAAAEPATVTIDNFAFIPRPLTVAAGTTVTWRNRDDIPHSIVVQALGVRSHALDTDEGFAYRFAGPGTYDYICGIHPFMHGRIVVTK